MGTQLEVKPLDGESPLVTSRSSVRSVSASLSCLRMELHNFIHYLVRFSVRFLGVTDCPGLVLPVFKRQAYV